MVLKHPSLQKSMTKIGTVFSKSIFIFSIWSLHCAITWHVGLQHFHNLLRGRSVICFHFQSPPCRLDYQYEPSAKSKQHISPHRSSGLVQRHIASCAAQVSTYSLGDKLSFKKILHLICIIQFWVEYNLSTFAWYPADPHHVYPQIWLT